MITYVNTVLVSNLASGAVLKALPQRTSKNDTTGYGSFIVMNCDPNVAANDIYNVDGTNAGNIQTIKVGYVTKKNMTLRNPNGTVTFQPIVKWSNEIKAADIKSYSFLDHTKFTSSEDQVAIDFDGIDQLTLQKFAEGGRRVIIRLTFKDMPHRYRKWTESYEYITPEADIDITVPAEVAAYKEMMASDIANLINADWKRARVQVSTGTVTRDANGKFQSFTQGAGPAIQIEALPYDDDDSVDSLSWANKVRFNANIYYTWPAADGWDANNKYFPKGVILDKIPGVQYAAEAKLVRDRESQAMGYQGILNRGEGTWPIIKPDMETDLSQTYDGLTLEFENMYRAADDIFRKTKQTLEIYAVKVSAIKTILDAFVAGVQQDEIVNK